jgi:pyruvate/2-oxoglutarate dehydrogenase complex dihydrolipoamide acyltransferase (E2) component
MDWTLPEFSEMPGVQEQEMSGGADLNEAEIGGWLVSDGGRVEAGQAAVEVSLDKATVILDAPAGGIIRQKVRRGDIVVPGDLLATIE